MVRFEEGHLVYYAVAEPYVCVYAHWVSHSATSFDRLIPCYTNVTRVKNDRVVACHDTALVCATPVRSFWLIVKATRLVSYFCRLASKEITLYLTFDTSACLFDS